MPEVEAFFDSCMLPHIRKRNLPDAVSEMKRYLREGGALEDILSLMRANLGKERGFGNLYYAYILMSCLFKTDSDPHKELHEYMDRTLFESFLKIYCENKEEFSKCKWYSLNKQIFFSSLHGLGINNYENWDISGENNFLQMLLTGLSNPVVLDVGANIGAYAKTAKSINATAKVFAFEPHPGTYKRLKSAGNEAGFAAFNFGLSDTEGKMTLYDRDDHPEGSSHASLYSEVIESLHATKSVPFAAEFKRLDDIVGKLDLSHINLLKIDTEGHELAVLQGAKETLAAGIIDCIHLEFNEMNVVSRVFLRDFFDLLPEYQFYRMLPDGLVPLGEYGPPVFMELFIFQNIVAVRKK